MPSQQDVTTFTLSFGGVNFCLEPVISTRQSEDVISVTKICSDQVVINFNNFSGMLRVHNGSSTIPTGAAEAPALATTEEDEETSFSVKNEEQAVPDAVPEEVPSPNGSPVHKKEEPMKKKGQQTLDFFGKKNEGEKKGEGTKALTSSKRSSSEKAPVGSRKKTRHSSNNEISVEKEINNDSDSEESTEVEDSQNTKFTMASLGQDMPSQDTAMEEDETAAVNEDAPKEKSHAQSDAGELDSFSINMDEYSRNSHDFSFKTDLTPKKSDAIVKAGTTSPCPRWGQSMTMIDHRRLVVYGGQTIDPVAQTAKPLADLFVYDLMEHEWTKPINCEGIARTWHSANFLPDKQLLLCFGGDVVDEKGRTTTTDQVMVLDTEIMLWYPPSVTGQIPSGRSGHTASLLHNSNELVVFGGVKSGKWLNSVAQLDTVRWKWSAPKILGDAPRPRSYHSATPLAEEKSEASRIVIFGGNNDTKCFNTVHVLEQRDGKMSWSHPRVIGKAPTPRTGHTATLLEDGSTIMIYGGWDPNTEDEKGDDLIFGDSFLLDTKNWAWKKGPKPRFCSFNTATTNNGGLERVGHSAVLAPGAEGTQVLAFGGRLPDGFAADFQSAMPIVQVQREVPSRRNNNGGEIAAA